MKKRLILIPILVLALVLALSSSLVTAVPVAAEDGDTLDVRAQDVSEIKIDGTFDSGEWGDFFWFTDDSEGPGTGYDDDPLPIFTGYLAFDAENLYLAFDVEDDTPNTNRDFLYVTIDIPPSREFNEPIDALYWGSIPADPSFFGEAYLTGDPFPWDRSERASTWGIDGDVVTARTITATNRYYELKIPLSAINAQIGYTIGLKVQARDSDYPAFQYVNYYPDMPDGITPIRSGTRVEVEGNFAQCELLPYPTIQSAIDSASPSDTIIVAAGTYEENVVINESVTLISDTGDYRTTETILTGPGPIFSINANGITVQGFGFNEVILTGGGQGAINCGTTAHADIVIQSNSFTNLGGPAVFEMTDLPSTGWLITDNKIDTVTGTDSSGLRLQRLTDSEISKNEISNTAYGGMILDNLENVVISGNTISNTPRKGIQIAASSDVVIEKNYITNTNTLLDADEGAITIYPDVTNIRIENNTLTANYQGFTVRDKPGTVSDVHVNFNNIYGNDGFGVGNFAQGGGIVDATNNWWGTTLESEIAAMVSGNVDYNPWFGAGLEESESETVSGSATITETLTGGDVTIDATGEHTITTAKYEENPGGSHTFKDLSDYYDVHLDDETDVSSLTVEFCPATESTIIYYWDGSSWIAASEQTYGDECIVVTITDSTHPSLSDLAGLPFASGTAAGPPPVGGTVYPPNKLALLAPWIVLGLAIIAGAVIIVRRRRAWS